MLTIKQRVWLCIACFHLMVVALHAAHLEEWTSDKPWLLKQITTYGDFTGSGNIFSFFAPHVGNEIAVVYTLGDGSHQEVTRLEGPNTECNRRIQTIYNFFSIEEAQSLLAKSCAAYMLRQHPSSNVVRVTVIDKRVPAMAAYRAGSEPKWEPFLVKDFRVTR
ncbi:hypothetical protein [Chitinophaga pinensis]|uniref:Uncharacterized protein n=1 Tax=Chitinophaga pinensis (strain ATCC 43595 / DSM 2588 / LMG 13176 / NBRC 15968 / NCIMB 11800 / UQM 2034) TaxID=485918 RepID=A0A979GRY9_CHIPD|nr:hypothetical protein [Chitinophaga pinensis]ACU57575.1 hypothetical protein Cpin_0069 [Chitinophaga pinensis DSM 2588]